MKDPTREAFENDLAASGHAMQVSGDTAQEYVAAIVRVAQSIAQIDSVAVREILLAPIIAYAQQLEAYRDRMTEALTRLQAVLPPPLVLS